MGEEREGLKGLGQFLEGQWYKNVGLATALITGIVITESLLVHAEAEWWLNLIIALTVELTIALAWWWSGRPPKTQRDRVGFLVCITCDDDTESKRLRADFIVPLQKLIRTGASGRTFQLLELPQHLARKVIDIEDAEKMRAACKAHFMIFGQVRRRPIDGVEKHVIDLDGIVTHKQAPDHVKKQFAKEFGELLPRKVHISTENDLFTFYFTTEWIDIVTKYIIGIAAAISGDISYAEKLYTDAQNSLKTKDTSFPVYQKLLLRLPERIAELHEARAFAEYEAWLLDHDPSHLKEIETHIQHVIEAIQTPKPRLNFLIAIHAFLDSRDIEKALDCLRKVKDPNSALWNFNMAFLNGYKGNLKQAAQQYRAASQHDLSPDLLSQVEDFMCWILKEEPDKYQISYCLGLFNWKVKGDMIQASKDFEEFLQAGSPTGFAKERELAKQWLEDFKK